MLGTLFEDYKVENGIYAKSFSFLFLCRRFCYACVLVCLVSNTKTQLYFCILNLFLPVKILYRI